MPSLAYDRKAGQGAHAASTCRGKLAGQDPGRAPCIDDLDATVQESIQLGPIRRRPQRNQRTVRRAGL